jgi:hypothetical protein
MGKKRKNQKLTASQHSASGRNGNGVVSLTCLLRLAIFKPPESGPKLSLKYCRLRVLFATEAQSIVGHIDCQHSILWPSLDKFRKVNHAKELAAGKFFEIFFTQFRSVKDSSKKLS